MRLRGSVSELVGRSVIALKLDEEQAGMTHAEVRLQDVITEDGEVRAPFEADTHLALGDLIELGLGDSAATEPWFRGTISSLEQVYSAEAAPEITLLAEDALQQARMQRRTRVFTDRTIVQLAEAIAGPLGLRVMVASGFTTRSVPLAVQLNESDLAFLRRLLLDHDSECRVVGDELQLSSSAGAQRGSVSLHGRRDFIDLRITADLADQVTSITVAGFDAQQGSSYVVTAQATDLGPGRGRTGADVLSSVFGERTEHIAHCHALDDAEAQAIANAAHDRRARSFVRLEGTVAGDPAIRVGARIDLAGVGPRFENTYQIVRVCHRYEQSQGYFTDFEATCAYVRGRI